jgi:hypothetical protein
MTVSELRKKLEELESVGHGNRMVVIEKPLSRERTLFEAEMAGGMYVHPVAGSIRQRYDSDGDIPAVIIL